MCVPNVNAWQVCFLSMTGEEGVRELDCALAICSERSPLKEKGEKATQSHDTKLGEGVESKTTGVVAPQVVED